MSRVLKDLKLKVILVLGFFLLGTINQLKANCQDSKVHQQFGSSLAYLEELSQHRFEWIELNKREVDSYQYYYKDLLKIRKLIKKSRAQYARLNDCIFNPDQYIKASSPDQKSEQFSLENLKAFEEVIHQLKDELRFLRVYDLNWAEKLSRKIENISRGVGQVLQVYDGPETVKSPAKLKII
jgi:hypothetical protein